MIKVIVNGARGKMGALACTALESEPGFELAAGLGRQDNLLAAIKSHQAELVLDLTRADAVYENSLTILNAGARAVIGTSGLTEAEILILDKLCKEKETVCLVVPNFSIGAVLMMQFAAQAARWLTEVEIIEAHHQQKLDAPSGTAMKTAELIAKARSKPGKDLPLHEMVKGARGGSHQGVRIHSLRLPGILARQEVLFSQAGETLSLSHDCIDRQAYMPGLILACRQVMGLQAGLHYGLETLLSA